MTNQNLILPFKKIFSLRTVFNLSSNVIKSGENISLINTNCHRRFKAYGLSMWQNIFPGSETAHLPVRLSRYHYCYGVESHKRKQPCTEPPDLQYTCTLGSKSRIYVFGDFEIRKF
ncbi:hypothetical protein T11_17088 [Trichinella zimbabwensis]|uniref:Uncharacterized protein n=1 Tax=Trichinella zimbabwensis TaxID=268475 RepID=A0A0V1I8N7_9BILA|nr:hypothetical protein T11_17088 [Trichinella zimbabwensis]